MPLSSEDHIAILRRLQSELKSIDPELQALAAEHVEPRNDPGAYLLEYLRVLARLMSQRSAGAHGRILNLLNQAVRTEEGGPVRGIRLELNPSESRALQREHVDLAALPDRTEIVERLMALRDELLRDRGQELDR